MMRATMSRQWLSLRQRKASVAATESANADTSPSQVKKCDNEEPIQDIPKPQAKVTTSKWKSAFDKNSFRTYYYNIDTKEVTWDKPQEESLEEEGKERADHVSHEKGESKSSAAVDENENGAIYDEKAEVETSECIKAEKGLDTEAKTETCESSDAQIEIDGVSEMRTECPRAPGVDSSGTFKGPTSISNGEDPIAEIDTSDSDAINSSQPTDDSDASYTSKANVGSNNNEMNQSSEATTTASEDDGPPTPTSFPSLYDRSTSLVDVQNTAGEREKMMTMMQKKAESRVVARDICAFTFDVVGDWTYYVYSVFHGGNIVTRHHAQYNIMVHMVMVISIIGTILSIWAIATSVERKRKMKTSLCFDCTVPRLALSLVLLHHVPQFILTTYTDLTFLGGYSAAGVLNICSSMSALINTMATTKCGEGYCGDGYCGEGLGDKLVGWNVGEDDTFEMGTITSDYDDTVRSDYEAMA